MDEKSLSDQISSLMNDTPEEANPVEADVDEQKDILAESLRSAAGQTDGALDAALDEFLSGKGLLHETTRSALTRGGSALEEVIKLLTSQFKLSPAVAKVIASLILKMQTSTGQDAKAKKKPRRKTKPKTASAKKKPGSAKKPKKKTTAKAKKNVAKKPAKKKTAAKTKPRNTKETVSKKVAKKKPAAKKTTAKSSKKKTTTKAKPKKAKRSNTVEIP